MTAISILILAAIYLSKIIYDVKLTNKKKVIAYVSSLVDEAIASTEEQFKHMKVEAAHKAGMALRQQPVEITKDPIKSNEYFQAGMKPVREMCHDNAKKYITASMGYLKDGKFKSTVQAMILPCIDDAIKMKIIGAKLGLADPIQSLTYRNMP